MGICNGANHEIKEIINGINLPRDERYYDKYDYDTSATSFNRGKLGDATKEMGPFQTMQYLTISKNTSSWYNDEVWLINSLDPWAYRGGGYADGSSAGIFDISSVYGDSHSARGFRLVLTF